MNQPLGILPRRGDVVELHDYFGGAGPSETALEALPPAGASGLGDGATVLEGGVAFRVAAQHATVVELVLFESPGDAQAQRPTRRLRLHGPDAQGRHGGLLRGAGPGLVYAYRVHGSAPGHDARRLLLDPTARRVVGRLGDAMQAAARARVPAPLPPLRSPRPRIAPARRVVMEAHAKGLTMALPGVPDALRGRFAGIAHPATIRYLRQLGVTTLSLLPVMQHLDEPLLAALSRTNYWGYNTLAFFCPDRRFATRPEDPDAVLQEFRAMADALHGAGLELWLDIVFNHTPEGAHDGPGAGPTLSWRGFDQTGWYRGADYSGCGNSPDLSGALGSAFVREVLVHWVREMGADGFRFDLAPALARGPDGAFDAAAPLLRALRDEPALQGVALVAEPWDAGPGPYRLGQFPPPWLEWNDRFRDAARGFWLQAPGHDDRSAFAAAFDGRVPLFDAARTPLASVNFVTAHDGFTLADLVRFKAKRNHANGEDNRDGRDDELCAAFGPEGDEGDADPAVRDTRARVQRALLATLCLAAGTPMLCAGDEGGNRQGGNNNAWNQDNASGWVDGPGGEHAEDLGTPLPADAAPDSRAALQRLVRDALALRARFSVLRPADAAAAATRRWSGLVDDTQALSFAGPATGGEPALQLVFNPDRADRPLPPSPAGQRWLPLLASHPAALAALPAGRVAGRTLLVLQAAPH